MAVGPDVQQAHREDTERYVLTNLNIVSGAGPGCHAQGLWPSQWQASDLNLGIDLRLVWVQGWQHLWER